MNVVVLLGTLQGILVAIIVSLFLSSRATGLGTDDVDAACYLYGNCGPTGTLMGAPVLCTGTKRLKPSVASIAMQRTR